MATLTINGRSVSPNPEQTILEAARAAGILDIPTLCWYPKLLVVGNCRICLVPVEGQAELLQARATKEGEGQGGGKGRPDRRDKPSRRVRRVLDVGQRGEHTEIIVGADGDPDKAGCTWGGECVRVCPTGAIFEVMPRERFAPEKVLHPDKQVRSVCPYCGVGCQVDLHVAGDQVVRVTSPDIELDTPNQGSTCVKGRFGYDFPQHHDRLTKPLIRKGWEKTGSRWGWHGGKKRRGGPWQTIEGEGQNAKPAGPPRSVGQSVGALPRLEA